MNSAGLQKCIENLDEYTKKWGLVLSMKKTRCVIFSETKMKNAKEVPFIYNNEPIPFETFYKYLGVEIANNCEFNIVKKERNNKARKAIFSIRQALATSGSVLVRLAMKLFDSKIEPTLTYGSIIWGIENRNNTIIIDGLKEVEREATKSQVAKVSRECFRNNLEPELELIKRIGRKNKDKLIRF